MRRQAKWRIPSGGSRRPGFGSFRYYPTNSLIISGPPAAVEKLIEIIK
jgi:type II secretory pathway component GspD/PulD (secretin)